MKVLELSKNLQSAIYSQVELMGKSNPLIKFAKPIITRAISKKFEGIDPLLEAITNKDGEVDIEELLTELIEFVKTSDPFTIKNEIFKDIEIGGGLLKLELPILDKKVVFNIDDLEIFKELVINKK